MIEKDTIKLEINSLKTQINTGAMSCSPAELLDHLERFIDEIKDNITVANELGISTEQYEEAIDDMLFGY